jgi:hypothetical protein
MISIQDQFVPDSEYFENDEDHQKNGERIAKFLARSKAPIFLWKPVFGCSGKGIEFLSRTAVQERLIQSESFAYDFSLDGPALLEEGLDVDRDALGEVVTYCVHAVGPKINGPISKQLLIGPTFVGFSAVPQDALSAEFRRDAQLIVDKIYEATQPKGPWGIDLLSVKGKPFVVDLNMGRFNGSHYHKLFQEQTFPQFAGETASFKVDSIRCPSSLAETVATLDRAGLLLDSRTAAPNGVWIQLCLPGLYVMLGAFAPNEPAVNALIDAARAALVAAVL